MRRASSRQIEFFRDWIVLTSRRRRPSSEFHVYQWDAALPDVEFHTPRTDADVSVETARVDIWLDHDGAVRGWLGLNLSGSWPQQIDIAWPKTCRPTSLYVAGDFRPLIAVDRDAARLEIPLPRAAKDNLVWLSWIDESTVHPLLSEPFAPRWPWPARLPVEHCLVNLHATAQIRFDVPASQMLPSMTPPNGYLPGLAAALAPDGEQGTVDRVWILAAPVAVGRISYALSMGSSLRRHQRRVAAVAAVSGRWRWKRLLRVLELRVPLFVVGSRGTKPRPGRAWPCCGGCGSSR